MVVIYYSDKRLLSHQLFPAQTQYTDNPYPVVCPFLGWGHPSDSLWIVPGTQTE